MPKARPRFASEFRHEAVSMVRSARPAPEVAEALGVSQQSLRKWFKQTQLEAVSATMG